MAAKGGALTVALFGVNSFEGVTFFVAEDTTEVDDGRREPAGVVVVVPRFRTEDRDKLLSRFFCGELVRFLSTAPEL